MASRLRRPESGRARFRASRRWMRLLDLPCSLGRGLAREHQVQPRGCWEAHATGAGPKLMRGTSRSAGAVISKNSRSLKPLTPASKLVGNW